MTTTPDLIKTFNKFIGKIEGAGQIDINTLISNALILYNLYKKIPI